jgi:adenylosuccinate synthase
VIRRRLRNTEPGRAILMADLGFGDAGKGLVSDYLCRERGIVTIIRYCGGPNAGHNVVTPDGRHATFVQLGAGSFVPEVKTLLSRFMLLNPLMLEFEVEGLSRMSVADIWSRLLVDRDAQVVTPLHVALNRLREEVRGDAAFGSTGQGVSEAVRQRNAGADVLLAGDLDSAVRLRRKLHETLGWAATEIATMGVNFSESPWKERDVQKHFRREGIELLVNELSAFTMHDYTRISSEDLATVFSNSSLLFEGSQGVLLDPTVGFAPYTTSTTTTFDNALTLLEEASFSGDLEKIGVVRTYATRHGPGPFVSEDEALARLVHETHNKANPDQGDFRVGYLDVVVLRYAIEAVRGVDWLAVTHCDTLPAGHGRMCIAYSLPEMTGQQVDSLFSRSGQAITGIRQPREPAHECQQELSRTLLKATPVLSDACELDDFVRAIESELSVPIHLTSYGPTANDVRVRE